MLPSASCNCLLSIFTLPFLRSGCTNAARRAEQNVPYVLGQKRSDDSANEKANDKLCGFWRRFDWYHHPPSFSASNTKGSQMGDVNNLIANISLRVFSSVIAIDLLPQR